MSVNAIGEGADAPGHAKADLSGDTIATLRDSLNWPEVKGNALATAQVARTLRAMREVAGTSQRRD